MTTPNQNDQRVTTKVISWKELVMKRWGKDYNKPDPGYEFSNGRKMETPKNGGPYA